jgi:hypothetical protein
MRTSGVSRPGTTGMCTLARTFGATSIYGRNMRKLGDTPIHPSSFQKLYGPSCFGNTTMTVKTPNHLGPAGEERPLSSTAYVFCIALCIGGKLISLLVDVSVRAEMATSLAH